MFSEKTFFPSERGQAKQFPWAFATAKGQVLRSKTLFPGLFRNSEKGQLSAEMIGISAVIMILFLIVVLIVWQRGLFTTLIGNINQNTQLCNRLSKIIADFNSNPGYSETMLELEAKVKIEPHSITVNSDGCPNCQYCYYSGAVNPAPNAALPLVLDKGEYLIETTGEGVKFTLQT